MDRTKFGRAAGQAVEKLELIGGGLWGGVFGITLIYSVFDDVRDGMDLILPLLLLTALGVWVFLKGLRRRDMRLLFPRYAALLSAYPEGRLEDLAAAAGTAPDILQRNFEYMLRKGFFPGGYIDARERRVVVPETKEKARRAAAETVTVTCPQCGGQTRLQRGKSCPCDYCGSFLRA